MAWYYFKRNKKAKDLQDTADLLTSISFHREISLEVDLFGRFIGEEFDDKDLVFFLYLWCLLEWELNVKFSKVGSVGKAYVDVWQISLTIKQTKKISQIFFEQDPENQNRFLIMIEKEGFGEEKSPKIPAIKFLILML